MDSITVESKPSPAKLDVMGVEDWPMWEKEVTVFPWTYGEAETCYILEGEAVVTPDGGTPVTIKRGDLVRFDAGLACTWDVRVPVKKHYKLG